MTLAVQQVKAEKEIFWLLELELTYRIEGKAWTQDGTYTNCWWMAHATEGEPSRVRQLLRSTHVVSTYAERATPTLCNNNASSWYYDPATGYLYVHTSGSDAPDTASKYYLSSHFWKYFSTHQYPMPNTIYDPNGLMVEARLGKVPADLTQEVNDFSEVGVRETWGSAKILNADARYDAALVTYVWHMCRFLLKVGAPGGAYANLTTIHRGRTGSVGWNDNEITVGIEDQLKSED